MKAQQKPKYKTIVKPRVINGLDVDWKALIDDTTKSSYQKDFKTQVRSAPLEISGEKIILESKVLPEKENHTQNKTINFDSIPDTLDQTVSRINGMNNLELKNANFEKNNNFGEKEMWLDQKDAFRKPVFAKVVTHPYSADFLKINLKSLLSCQNEYFPYLNGGKCLCGSCTCGKCKCVHFKYKNKNNGAKMVSSYNQDYLPW